MVRRDQEVARGNVVPQRACANPDREHAHLIGKPQRDGLDAEPVDRNAAAVMGEDEIAALEGFHGHFAVRGPDQGAGHEADRVRIARDVQLSVVFVEVKIVGCVGKEKEVALLVLDDDAAVGLAAFVRNICGSDEFIFAAIAQRTAGDIGNLELLVARDRVTRLIYKRDSDGNGIDPR